MTRKFYVYRHRRLDNNQVFYIGIGNEKRPYTESGRNRYWKRIVAKAGFEAEILHICDTWEEACETEILLISYYGRKDLGTGILVNMTNGGDGVIGQIYTEEARAKMSKARLGKTFSEGHKKKMSEAATGRKLDEDTLKKLSEYRKNIMKDTEYLLKNHCTLSKPVIMLPQGVMFSSSDEAALVLGLNAKSIRSICTGAGKTLGGFEWKYI